MSSYGGIPIVKGMNDVETDWNSGERTAGSGVRSWKFMQSRSIRPDKTSREYGPAVCGLSGK